MPTLAQIKTKKVSLGTLLENSLSIQSMDATERERLIEAIKKLPKEKQKKVVEILLEEQQRAEEMEQSARKVLKEKVDKVLLEIKSTERTLEKMIRKKGEEVERKTEEEQGEAILKKLDD